MTRKETIAQYPSLDSQNIMQLTAQKQPHKTNYMLSANTIATTTYRIQLGSSIPANTNGSSQQNLKQLHNKLLSVGGYDTLLPDLEEDYSNIITYGQLWDNLAMHLIKGRPSQCHSNTADLWYNNRDSYQHTNFIAVACTGYALSDDGLWRQHSWLIQAKARANVLIETTEKRLAYFGFAMTYEQANQFARDNF